MLLTPTVLANILRTDREFHRPMPAHSEELLTVRALARQHQEAIWALQQTVIQLRSVLLEFYPTALSAFPNLTHRAARTILAAAPTPSRGAKLTKTRIVSLLRKAGRGNRAGLSEQIAASLKAPRLTQPSKVEHALGHAVAGLIGIVESSTSHTTLKSEDPTKYTLVVLKKGLDTCALCFNT